ncbi:prepilin-type N-terminal cleavage/methylation domain-containing protein [Shewanella fidelis]|uniref:Prepilin-type N-terminal cleavage/methylation domain-containing protein n=1 Tax=Shewanella fidelis TaxID=173509 RepID=A0AAW8NLM1_9GAMM|nr:prepilin-type N-terminal cleavage/methylation domain-containing protein [Shewanella fidelis]MDR8522813.1 prepilin-type N-terminal cleavage/methylation domain-containing protein [Shewanella fidelis]MDW4814150.1 prepilin-type N-terminal cleavage/methylation domain-containing protein [Shewanella fidelis]MDW4818141.1 prepilin-type N-terminal cleavage/methylation domain-containing protein [Shewanella fidelis]MDW4822208.1 prepilin-type N-terminal cleavage/methylation domain-containing protein [She
MQHSNRQKGFTLIELVVVIIIVAVLAVAAAPKFINLSSDAKSEVIEQIQASAKTANKLVYAKTQMPSLSKRPHGSRDDITDIDINGDGNYNTRLIYGYLDNEDLVEWLELDDVFAVQEQGRGELYIGYDSNDNGAVIDDLCYFKYVQAASANSQPLYSTENTGC